MEEFSKIKKEVQEKQGKEWLGMQLSTEKQLESFMYYLDHPKLEGNPSLSQELIDLYYTAKESGFIKMEGIIRKLDQLRITLGAYKAVQQKGASKTFIGAQHIKSEIDTLKNRIGDFMQTSIWNSLLPSTQNAIETFTNYLDHRELQNRAEIFEEMLKTYNSIESGNFEKMQSLTNLLNKVEIKLGPILEEEVIEEIAEEIEPRLFCQECGNENRDTAKFCDNCGLNLFEEEKKDFIVCIYCNNENRSSALYCDKCGKNLQGDDTQSFEEFFKEKSDMKKD
jgi:hypothetical protein